MRSGILTLKRPHKLKARSDDSTRKLGSGLKKTWGVCGFFPPTQLTELRVELKAFELTLGQLKAWNLDQKLESS